MYAHEIDDIMATEAVIMEEKMRNKLKIGFMISRWGIDFLWSALLFTICWVITAIIHIDGNMDFLGITAMVCIILGLIFFAVGRTIVGLQSRKINFLSDRPRTEEEEWFLQEMLGIEGFSSRSQNFMNQVTKAIPGKADDVLAVANSTGIISHYFAVGKVYMGENIFINRLILLVSILAIIIIMAILILA